MSAGLHLDRITFAYEAELWVLQSVSLAITPGKLTGIVGPNGCGKSTLLRIASGLLKPKAGEVQLDGQGLGRYGALERARKIGFLPQQIAPAFSLSAAEVVALGRYPHAALYGPLNQDDKAAVFQSLEATDTVALANRAFQTLSGGERQRVLLASVLAQDPKYLLLDEPTASLDLHHAADVFALLQRLVAQGYGVGVVTHDVNLAAQVCDQLLLLGEDHRTVALGTVSEVFTEEALCAAYGSPIQVGTHPFTGLPFAAARSL